MLPQERIQIVDLLVREFDTAHPAMRFTSRPLAAIAVRTGEILV
jgi:hypothetical protein